VLVVGVTIVVVQVPLQTLPALRLGIPGIQPALLLKAITVIPAGAMLAPNAHAHPAKFVSALAARHVVAATVLLNG